MPMLQEPIDSDVAAAAGQAAERPPAEGLQAATLSAGALAWPPAGLTQMLPELPGLPPVEVIEAQLTAVEREMDGLREEVESLRKRDRTLNFYMQRLDEELRLAARLQQEFLPKAMP